MYDIDYHTLALYAHRLARHAPRWILDEEDLYQIGALSMLTSESPWAAWRDMIDALRKEGQWVRDVSVKMHGAYVQNGGACATSFLVEVLEFCNQAKPLERAVLRSMYEGDTLAECGKRLGRTEGRISQVRTKMRRTFRG